jgi:hypothetical protein
MGIDALWKQIQAQSPVDHAGKLPVVQYTGSRPEKVGKGTTRVPLFEVVSWVARPAALSDASVSDEIIEQPKPAAKPAPSKPAPLPVMDDDEMFS